MSVSDCKIVSIQNFFGSLGKISIIEKSRHVPFEIKRVYFLYDNYIVGDLKSHGHRRLQQFLVVISGSCKITLYDGVDKKIFSLNNQKIGLYISSMIWREISLDTPDTVILVLASEIYDDNDYYGNFAEFFNI